MTTHSSTSPSDPAADPVLEANLRALTTYSGEPTALWQDALAAHDSRKSHPIRLSFVLKSLGIAAILLLVVGALLPTLGKARSVGRVAFEDQGVASAPKFPERELAQAHMPAYPEAAKVAREFDSIDGMSKNVKDSIKQDADASREKQGYLIPSADSAPARSVIRKATIELAVPSTRESFAKCQHLLRIDLGEFVEGSSLTGQAEDARGQLTLRVVASRLSEVLNALREMGKLDSENASGDDVTAQVVDLDARLRNERTVECEILKLLESRKDSQLKDILDLRDKLAAIRAGIERLQGQRDTLGRQVSLATILVILRPDNAPKPAPKPASMFDGFTSEMGAAWTNALSTLTQTIAFFIRVLVGGLIWWALLIVAIIVARRALHRWLPDPAAAPRGV